MPSRISRTRYKTSMSSSTSTTPTLGGKGRSRSDRKFVSSLSPPEQMVLEMLWHLAEPAIEETSPERDIYIINTALGNKNVFFEEIPAALTKLCSQDFICLSHDVSAMTAANLPEYRNAKIMLDGADFWRLGAIFSDPDARTYASVVVPAFLATATHLCDVFPAQYFFREGPKDMRPRPKAPDPVASFGAPAVCEHLCDRYLSQVGSLVCTWESAVECRFLNRPDREKNSKKHYSLGALAELGAPQLEWSRLEHFVKLLLQGCSLLRAGKGRMPWDTLQRWAGAATRAALLVPWDDALMASYVWAEAFRVRSELTLARVREIEANEGGGARELGDVEWSKTATKDAFADRDTCAKLVKAADDAWERHYGKGKGKEVVIPPDRKGKGKEVLDPPDRKGKGKEVLVPPDRKGKGKEIVNLPDRGKSRDTKDKKRLTRIAEGDEW